MNTLEHTLAAQLLDNPTWHCFGVRDEIVSREQASLMLEASQTRLLPLNTNQGRLLVGHGDVTWESFRDEAEERALTPCLNINLRTAVDDAVYQAMWASEQSGITLLKLEVLARDHRDSDDHAVCVASGVLMERGFTVMPLISPSVRVARPLVDLGCPILRVMGSPIGSGRGIQHPAQVAAICRLGVPVVLDGGIGTPAHARQALELGCQGFLVNSALFVNGRDPAAELGKYRQVAA